MSSDSMVPNALPVHWVDVPATVCEQAPGELVASSRALATCLKCLNWDGKLAEPECWCGADTSTDGFRYDIVCPKHDR